MRKLKFALVIACALAFSGLTAWSYDGGRSREKDGMSATEMSLAGVLAAGAIGVGAYVVRRRSNH